MEEDKTTINTEVKSETTISAPIPAPTTTTTSTTTEIASAETAQKPSLDINKVNQPAAATTEDPNSTISPIYSRWKSFSFKVLENVKKQSETVKEVYQKDLSEFVTTITNESQNLKRKIINMAEKPEGNATSPAVEAAPNKEGENANKEVNGNTEEPQPERISLRAKRNSSLINRMSVGINSFLNKNKPEMPQKKKNIFDRKEALIYELQTDPLTYLIDPLYDPESTIERIQEYKKFTQKFDLFTYHVEIDKLLDEVEEVKMHHSTIVPARLPEEIFWQRYFFKLKELEDSEEQKKQLVKDVAANINQEEEIKWDSDDDDKAIETDIKKSNVNTTTTATTTTTAAADKKAEDSDDDWGNWE